MSNVSNENVKVSGGIVLIRSKSGTTRIQKVLVHAKHGHGKNQIKCRLRKCIKRKPKSRIPVLVRHGYRRREKRNASRIPVLTKCYKKKLGGKIKGSSSRNKDSGVGSISQINASDTFSLSSEDQQEECPQKFDSRLKFLYTDFLESKNSILKEQTVSESKIRITGSKNKDSGVGSVSQTNASDTSLLSKDQPKDDLKFNTLYNGNSQSKSKNLVEQTVSESDYVISGRTKSDSDEISTDVDTSTAERNNLRFIKHETSSLRKRCLINEESDSSTFDSSFGSTFLEDFSAIKRTQIPLLHAQSILKIPISESTLPQKSVALMSTPTSTIIMSQYETVPTPFERGIHSQLEIEEVSNESVISQKKYIDSGLRRLKSDESKLYLSTILRVSKDHIVSDEEDVKPLLKKLSSSIFKKAEEKRRKLRVRETLVEKEPEETKELEAEEIDEEPTTKVEDESKGASKVLQKLEEFEDVKFTVKTKDLKPKKVEEKPEENVNFHKEDTTSLSKHSVQSKEWAEPVKELVQEPVKEQVKEPAPDVHVKSVETKKLRHKGDFCVHIKEPSSLILKDSEDETVESKKETKQTKPKEAVKRKELKNKNKIIISLKIKLPFCECSRKENQKQIDIYQKKPETCLCHSDNKTKPKKKSLFKFFKKGDFCVHTADPPSENLSAAASRVSVFTTETSIPEKSKQVSQSKSLKNPKTLRKSVSTLLASSEQKKLSISNPPSESSSRSSLSHSPVILKKQRSRFKNTDDDSRRSNSSLKSARAKSLTSSSANSSTLLVNNKQQRRRKSKLFTKTD